MRVVFFGTPAFAVPTLTALLDSAHDVVGVVTQPDRPRGRGQKISHAPVKALAVQRGIPIMQPDRLKRDAFEEDFVALKADQAIEWDGAAGRITNAPDANQYLTRQYRKGWEL